MTPSPRSFRGDLLPFRPPDVELNKPSEGTCLVLAGPFQRPVCARVHARTAIPSAKVCAGSVRATFCLCYAAGGEPGLALESREANDGWPTHEPGALHALNQ